MSHFSPDLFTFLKGLKRHNDRDWFRRHQERYERHVREPSLAFIAEFGTHLQRVAPRFAAIPTRVGGSLFRIHRDTRFSADKRPYKTHVGIYFPHKLAGRDVHGPVFYLHLEPEACFAGAGLWHPERDALRAVREAIVQRPDAWRRIRRSGILSDEGERLKIPPRGYDPAHPFVEDLKRKDFLSMARVSEARICSPHFMADLSAVYRRSSALVRFLTEALGLQY